MIVVAVDGTTIARAVGARWRNVERLGVGRAPILWSHRLKPWRQESR